MQKLLIALFATTLLVQPVLAAEAKKDEPQKKEEKAPAKSDAKKSEPQKKEEKAPAKKDEAKKEKACIDKMKDGKPVMGKDGKPEQVCKEVKVHEKLEGTKVPDKK
jgi:Ni/Co efflux regulator RcnB